jgi:hypothetical protein
VNRIQGVQVGRSEHLTHLLFVDDVLIFYRCLEAEGKQSRRYWIYFVMLTGMMVNINKSTLYFPKVEDDIKIGFDKYLQF